MIQITAADGHTFSAYRADPADSPKGGIVVLPEVYGLSADIRKAVDLYAGQGYIAIAPSLFDRVRQGAEFAYDDAGLNEGVGILREVGVEAALADVQATVNLIAEVGKVALVGYDWGAFLTFHAANQVKGLACAVAYYGIGIVQDQGTKRKIPTVLHFGNDDPHIPPATVSAFRMARPDVTVYSYPAAGHGFAFEGHSTYNPEVAALALERSLTMITHCVQGPPTVTLKNAGFYAAAKTEKKKKPALEDLEPPM